MNRAAISVAVAALAVGASIGSADAKKVYYEINGQRYSYSTNNRQEVQDARARIEAADAASAAKAKAEAERAANPLSAVFGSQAQREAAEAQARVERVLADPGPAAVKAREPSRRREAKPLRAAPRSAEAEPKRKAVRAKATADATAAVVKPPVHKPDATLVAAPVGTQPSGKAGIKSVSFDLASGIKTTEMTDGSVHEEAFDSSALPKLGTDGRAPDSLTGFVEQVRKPQRGDATGSIGKAEAQTPAAK
jgi:hypothetical protein